jgi:hypothetical protein
VESGDEDGNEGYGRVWFLPSLAPPMHGPAKFWCGFQPPTSSQYIGVKLYWMAEASTSTPKNWFQSKQRPYTWSTPIIWRGSTCLQSKHTLYSKKWTQLLAQCDQTSRGRTHPDLGLDCYANDLTNSNINIADHIVLTPTNQSLDDHIVANRCKSMSSEPKKSTRWLTLHSRGKKKTGLSTRREGPPKLSIASEAIF